MPYTQEQLLEMYRKLPKEIQDAIFSVDTAEAIRQIGEKRKLMIDKIGELADETGLVMLGLVHPSQYISHLSERLAVDKETAREIAQEINAKIFGPIREHLKKIHGLTEKEVTIPPPEPSIPPSPPRQPEPPPSTPPTSPPKTAPAPPPLPPPPATKTDIVATPTDIFEAKTKEEIFRKPITAVEKPAETAPPPAKKFDPYRESTS
jgi:hypothetical protein